MRYNRTWTRRWVALFCGGALLLLGSAGRVGAEVRDASCSNSDSPCKDHPLWLCIYPNPAHPTLEIEENSCDPRDAGC